MSSKTKIVVLHMKEIIYTGIFLVLGVLLLIFLIILFLPEKNDTTPTEPTAPTVSPTSETTTDTPINVASSSVYIPGIYTTEVVLNDQVINVEVIVDQTGISSVELVNISESVATMYPLLEPAFDSLSSQIIETQSLDDITYAQESKYTTLVLLEAIRKSLDKAQP